MKKAIIAMLAVLLVASNVMSAAFVRDEKVLKDSKPETLSIPDMLYLDPVTVEIGRTTIKVLVYRFTTKVAYVFHNNYERYIRPKYIMPNIQSMYDESRKK